MLPMVRPRLSSAPNVLFAVPVNEADLSRQVAPCAHAPPPAIGPKRTRANAFEGSSRSFVSMRGRFVQTPSSSLTSWACPGFLVSAEPSSVMAMLQAREQPPREIGTYGARQSADRFRLSSTDRIITPDCEWNRCMHILIGFVLAIFAFALLLRPLRWITGIWIALLVLTFIPMLLSGASDKLFDTDTGLVDDMASTWAIAALIITPRVFGAFFVFSLIWRAIASWRRT